MAKMVLLKNVQARTGTRDSRSVNVMIKDILVGDIVIRENVRKDYTGIEELAESIRKHGLLQPITVYADGEQYIVKTGHRRFLSCQSLYQTDPERFHSIRCIVSDAKNIAVIQLVENVQREDLKQIDLCSALSALREQGMSHREIALAMGKTEGYVKNLFMGVNDVNNSHQLAVILKSHAGVTLQDVAETRNIPEYKDRVDLLEQRGNGTVNRAKMRERIKVLKSAIIDNNMSDQSASTPPTTESSVKISVSSNGLVIKLAFSNNTSAKVMGTGIRRLLGRHGIKEILE